MDPLVAPSPSQAACSQAKAFSHFGLNLYHQLPPEGNAFFSSMSLAMALGALWIGARGETRKELAAVLGLHGEDGPDGKGGLQAMSELLEALGPRKMEEYEWDQETGQPRSFLRDSFELNLATALFVEQGYPLHTAFCERLESSLAADFFSVLFSDPNAAAKRINSWVAAKTQGRIPSLVTPDSLQESCRMVPTNAIYFKAAWASPFEENQTRQRQFHLLPGSSTPTVDLPMMTQEGDYQYWAGGPEGLQALSIPYESGLSMLVLLPETGRFREVEAALDEELLLRIGAEANWSLVDLQLPKFEMRSSFELGSALQALGLRDAFNPVSSNFSGITLHPEGLVLSKAIHEAWVKMDEQGTEATAATALMMLAAGVEQETPTPIPFIVDRPFFFFIRDEQTGAVLFMGRVLDPTE